MKLLNKLTASPSQLYNIVTELGDQFILELRFLPALQMWVINITWGTFELNGCSLVISPNLLHNYSNNLPFGLMVTSTDSIEPSYLDDFTTQRIKLYILTPSDITQLETALIP